NQMVAMPPQGTQGTNFLRGPEATLEQPESVQFLQPGGIADIGLLLEIPGQRTRIDHQHLEALRFQKVAQSHPVHTGRFEHDARDTALPQPVREGPQVSGEDAKRPNRCVVTVGRNRYDVSFAADIDARGVRMNYTRWGSRGTLFLPRHDNLR